MSAMSTQTKYPNIEVNLIGQDGNSFVILGLVKRALLKNGVSGDETNEFMQEAMSGDYNHLLTTCMDWVTVN